ncbi:MAG: hypothetical protein AAGD38_11730 [Acidobacteriota bacterium]
MKHTKVLWTLLCLLLVSLPIAAEEMSVDDIIAKNVEARGGMDAIKAIESAKMMGAMNMGGMEAPIVYAWERPNKLRIEFTMQGMTAVQAYDGETGWFVMPFMGKDTPEKMADDQLNMIVEQTDFDGMLIDYKDKGHAVEYVGQEEIDGTPAHHLKITKKSGDIVDLYLDTDYFLEFKSVQKQNMQGMEVEMATTFGDYKEVGGVLMPHSLEMGTVGAPAGQIVTIESIEVNQDIPDGDFAMPEVEAPAEAGAEG